MASVILWHRMHMLGIRKLKNGAVAMTRGRKHQTRETFRTRCRLTRREMVLLGVAGALGGVWLYARDTREGFRPRRVLPPQPPITDPPLMSAERADRILNPAELVLGVRVGDQARCYPINMLTGPQREIVNDTVAGCPVAATW